MFYPVKHFRPLSITNVGLFPNCLSPHLKHPLKNDHQLWSEKLLGQDFKYSFFLEIFSFQQDITFGFCLNSLSHHF